MPVAATVYLSESNGAGEVVTDNISNINFGGVDLPNLVPANHPAVRSQSIAGPGAGNCWSFFKALRVKVQSMGDSLLISDLRFWKTSGANVAGERIWRVNTAALAYAQPNLSPNISIDDLYSSDPETPVIGISGSYAGTISIAPAYSNYLQLQLAMNSALLTPIGAVNQKTIAFTYSES